MQVLCTKGGKGSTALAELDRAHELRLKMDEKSMAQATSKTIARTLAQAQQASKEAEGRRQAQAAGLTLRVAGNSTGYSCVSLGNPGQPKPYQARVKRGDKKVHLHGL